MEVKIKTPVTSDKEDEGKNETQIPSDEMKMKVKIKTQVISDEDEEGKEGINETLAHLDDEADSNHSGQKKRSRQWHQEVEGKRKIQTKMITSPKYQDSRQIQF